MIRYERTGEFRIPKTGEWFENGAPFQWGESGQIIDHYWILRRVEEPPPEPTRPGTEEVLTSLCCAKDGGIFAPRDMAEAIRRVRAWEKAREYLQLFPENRVVSREKLLAILDGEA